MVRSDDYGLTLGVVRLILLFAALAVLVVFSRPTPLSVSTGFAIVAVGEAIRVWAAGHLQKTVELVTSGPYRFTRNPMYLGRLMILTGLCVMMRLPYGLNLVALGLGYIGFFAYYLPRKERVERARLRERHGAAFERYERQVPPLFPAWIPYPDAALRGWSSARFTRNREHWMMAGLAALTALLLWVAYVEPEGLFSVWRDRW